MADKTNDLYTPISGSWTVDELRQMVDNKITRINLTECKEIDDFIPHLHNFNEVTANIESLPKELSLPSIEKKAKKAFIFLCDDLDVNTSEVAMIDLYCMIKSEDGNQINRVRRNLKLNNCCVTMINILPEDIYFTVNNMVNSQIALLHSNGLINICIDCNDRILRKENDSSLQDKEEFIQDKDEAIKALLRLKMSKI